MRVDAGTIDIQTTGDALITGIETGNGSASAIRVASTAGHILDNGDTRLDIITDTGPAAKLTIKPPRASVTISSTCACLNLEGEIGRRGRYQRAERRQHCRHYRRRSSLADGWRRHHRSVGDEYRYRGRPIRTRTFASNRQPVALTWHLSPAATGSVLPARVAWRSIRSMSGPGWILPVRRLWPRSMELLRSEVL